MNRRRWSALGAVLVVLAVAAGANTPAQERAMLHSHGVLHPWFHLIIFGGMTWLAQEAARARWMQASLLGGILALGVATEYVEYRFHASPLECGDMVLDALGALFGAGVAMAMQRRRLQRSEGRWE